MGWDVGNDVNVPWACLHVWCYARLWAGVWGMMLTFLTCTHTHIIPHALRKLLWYFSTSHCVCLILAHAVAELFFKKTQLQVKSKRWTRPNKKPLAAGAWEPGIAKHNVNSTKSSKNIRKYTEFWRVPKWESQQSIVRVHKMKKMHFKKCMESTGPLTAAWPCFCSSIFLT